MRCNMYHTFYFADVTFWFITVIFCPISQVSSGFQCNAQFILIIIFLVWFTGCPERCVVPAWKVI